MRDEREVRRVLEWMLKHVPECNPEIKEPADHEGRIGLALMRAVVDTLAWVLGLPCQLPGVWAWDDELPLMLVPEGGEGFIPGSENDRL